MEKIIAKFPRCMNNRTQIAKVTWRTSTLTAAKARGVWRCPERNYASSAVHFHSMVFLSVHPQVRLPTWICLHCYPRLASMSPCTQTCILLEIQMLLQWNTLSPCFPQVLLYFWRFPSVLSATAQTGTSNECAQAHTKKGPVQDDAVGGK